MGFATRGVAAAALLGTLALAAPAQATLVTYQFTGQLDSVFGSDLQPTFSLGNPVTGSWTVDSSVPAGPFNNAVSANFPAITAFTITITLAPSSFYTASATSGAVQVLSQSFGDTYRASAGATLAGPAVGGLSPSSVVAGFFSTNTTLFDPANGPLPTDFDLSDFTNANGGLSFGAQSVTFFIDTLTRLDPPTGVPAPGGLALLGAGLLGLFGLRRLA
jgi:hypothetical protein